MFPLLHFFPYVLKEHGPRTYPCIFLTGSTWVRSVVSRILRTIFTGLSTQAEYMESEVVVFVKVKVKAISESKQVKL